MQNRIQEKGLLSFNILGGTLLGLLALCCLIPFIMVISGSFSAESDILVHGYSLFPRVFSLDAYRVIFKSPEKLLISYRNTIFYTLLGTLLSLTMTSMTGFVLSRKNFTWRNGFTFYFYFTTLFSGGLIPSYILMISLGLKNTIWVNIFSNLLSVFNLLLMRNFMSTIPDAISEAARIDGANDFLVYRKLILPLSTPAIATIGLFTALGYWNSWYNCMLYITDYRLYTLQFYLYNTLNQAKEIEEMLQRGANITTDISLPSETTKLAMTCVTIGPILLLYPFVQRFFIKGLTVGAVKG